MTAAPASAPRLPEHSARLTGVPAARSAGGGVYTACTRISYTARSGIPDQPTPPAIQPEAAAK